MKQNVSRIITKVVLSLICFVSFVDYVWADAGTDPNPTSFVVKLQNPLSVNTLNELLTLILNLVINAGIPVLTIMIIWTGFLFIKAQGNQTQLDTAKRNLAYVLIGTAIVLGVFSILAIIQATVQAIGA